MAFKSAVVLSLVAFTSLIQSSALADLRFDSSVTPALKAQVIGDLAFISGVQSSVTSPLHKKIFGEVKGAVYKSWFEKRIVNVGMTDCGGPSAVACVYSMDPHRMYINPSYTTFNVPQISRVQVIYHEARHSEVENGSWSHATCPTPFKDENGQDVRGMWSGTLLQGKAGCDRVSMGSYGSSGILLRNIALNCSNCTDKVKADADLYALDTLKRIIDPAAKAEMKIDYKLK